MSNPENYPTEDTLERLREIRKTYVINPEAKLRNAGKKILMMTGPSGAGKSRLTDMVIELRPDIEPIATRTTRNRRSGKDPESFTTADEGFTHELALDLAERGEPVNFSLFGDQFYGTLPEDFADFSIGPITADSVPLILNGGFETAAVIYPVVNAEKLHDIVREERLSLKDIGARLDEGVESTNFALSSIDEPWFYAIENSHEEGGLRRAAETIIAIGEGQGSRLDRLAAVQGIVAMRSVFLNLKESL